MSLKGDFGPKDIDEYRASVVKEQTITGSYGNLHMFGILRPVLKQFRGEGPARDLRHAAECKSRASRLETPAV